MRGLSNSTPARDLDAPPLPADPLDCRWCGGRRLAIGHEHSLCIRSGCFDNDQAPFTGRCEECRVEFLTGCYIRQEQCWRCDRREHRQYVAAYAEPSLTGYARDKRSDAVNRRVMERKRSTR